MGWGAWYLVAGIIGKHPKDQEPHSDPHPKDQSDGPSSAWINFQDPASTNMDIFNYHLLFSI